MADSLLGFDQIWEMLKSFIPKSNDRQKKRDDRSEMSSVPFKGFQAPLRGALHNSGGFDPTGKGSVGRPHQGVDLRAPGGTSIYPCAPGIVEKVYSDPKGGNALVIKHPNGYSSYYAHCGTISAKVGDQVSYDTVIAAVGASGNAKGFPHLHLQLWNNGALIDPASVIPMPTYTAFNPKKEQLWLPGAKEIADNWKPGNKPKAVV